MNSVLEEQPRTIDYATPDVAPRRRWISPRLLTASLLITFFLQVDFLFVGSDIAKQMFLDFHLKLPIATQLFLDIADWWTHEFGWAFAWPLAVLIPVAISALRRPAPPRRQGEG